MSDSNRVSLAYIVETTYGETPAGTLQDLRYTSESLTSDTPTTISQEVRNDRQIPDVIRTGLSASGDIGYELSFGTFDDFIQAAMQSFSADAGTWGTAVATETAQTDISVSDNDTFNSVGGWDNVPAVGDWIEVRGFSTNANNNGYFKVASVDANNINVEGTPLTAETAGDTVTVKQWPVIENGTTFKSHSIEKDFSDDTGSNFAYTILTGLGVDQWTLNIAADQIITGTFSFVGKDEDRGTSSAGTGNTAATTTSVFNGIDNVKQVKLGATAFDIVSATMTLQNNLRARLQVGSLGAISIGSGVCSISGTLQAYFENANEAEIDKYHDFTLTDLSFVIEDGSNQGYIFDFPAIKLTAGRIVSGGQNQDIMMDFQWQARLDPTDGVTLRIAKFD